MTVNFRDEIKKDMRESGFNVHKKYDDLTVPELQEVCKKEQKPFAVCALSVTGDLNIGSMIRTASLFGAEKFIVFGRRKFDRRGLVGANNYIDIELISGLNEDLSFDSHLFNATMITNEYVPVFVEQGGIPLGSFSWKHLLVSRKPCLIFGNENRGIPQEIIDDSKGFKVSIPQCGVIRSHNVSVASGIVMYDLCKNMQWV